MRGARATLRGRVCTPGPGKRVCRAELARLARRTQDLECFRPLSDCARTFAEDASALEAVLIGTFDGTAPNKEHVIALLALVDHMNKVRLRVFCHGVHSSPSDQYVPVLAAHKVLDRI